jgi:hypothetical protein
MPSRPEHLSMHAHSTGMRTRHEIGHSPDPNAIPEIAIARWWAEAPLTRPLRTVDGQTVEIVFRGTWSHGMGPDFRDAMITTPDGELRSGSIEIHRHSADWRAHGHDRDPAYNDVVLHLVLAHDGQPTRRVDGNSVPVAILDLATSALSPAESIAGDWSRIGGAVCADDLWKRSPARILRAVWDLGDRRLGAKAARVEALLTDSDPGQVLWEQILDGLGYSSNREPMRLLARSVPLQTLTSLATTVEPDQRPLAAMGVLLGAAGFLPLAQPHAEAGGLQREDVLALESHWAEIGGAWHRTTLPPSRWKLARVRPANHPARRIATAGLLATRSESGLVFETVEAIRARADLMSMFVEWSEWQGERLLGAGRAADIVINTCIPFALALAHHSGDAELAEAVGECWERHPPGELNSVVRRAAIQVAGKPSLRGLGARGQQGLILLDGSLCQPRRCFECPIAHLVVTVEPPQAGDTEPVPPRR